MILPILIGNPPEHGGVYPVLKPMGNFIQYTWPSDWLVVDRRNTPLSPVNPKPTNR